MASLITMEKGLIVLVWSPETFVCLEVLQVPLLAYSDA